MKKRSIHGEYVSILHKLPARQRRDGLKYKAKRVLKSAMRRLDLSFAKQNNRPSTQPSGVRWGFEMAFRDMVDYYGRWYMGAKEKSL